MRIARFATLFALGSIILVYPVCGYCHVPEMQPRPFTEEKLKEYEKKDNEKSYKKVEKNRKEGKKSSKSDKHKADKHRKDHTVKNKTR